MLAWGFSKSCSGGHPGPERGYENTGCFRKRPQKINIEPKKMNFMKWGGPWGGYYLLFFLVIINPL